ncbi:Flp pilus assembly protein CpaB [Seohaeicola saemankumensis]|jgi:pilus assembly protein CpaB|uniref:Flp pilus assembly protein CpaB n=1 Tax=Seohaeicola TaxID=481178 RepID=UPI0007F4BA0E|nr:Flp pilus assembly protein CpaB [Paracoccaceae bacterium]OAN70881.1 Flp pilus assembly protein CpaB [Rhodobacteraceae bacterium EhC02]
MRAVFGLVLIAGVGLAGFAVMMAKKQFDAYQMQLAQAQSAQSQIIPTVEVFVANKTLNYGDVLTAEDLRAVKWPSNAIPEGTFAAMTDIFPENNTAPRYVLRIIEKDEALMASKISLPGEDAGINSRIERGMRAFAIKVDVASGVSGFLRPGDRVDVYWTGSINQDITGEARGEITKLIEANVRLIAVDQSADGGMSEALIARTVTVAARPDQVAALAQAQSTGRLSLSLVGANDDTIAEAIEVDQRALLGLVSAPIAAPVEIEKEEVCTTRVRRGAEVVELAIPCTN